MFTAEAQRALVQLGIPAEKLAMLESGEPVAFSLAGAARGTLALAQIEANHRFRVGILTMKSPGRGLNDLMTFDARARAAAKALKVREIELMGIEITQSRLREVLLSAGFLPSKMPIPEELGGGECTALSRIKTAE